MKGSLSIILTFLVISLGIVGGIYLSQLDDIPTDDTPDIPNSEIEINFTQVFDRGAFSYPTGIYFHDNLSDNTAWVTELAGKIIEIDLITGENTTLLNIRSEIGQITDEEGLVGFAFDPEFSSNGYIYLHYTITSPLTTHVSRFTYNSTTILPESEMIMLSIDQPYANHNGGGLVFDEEGLLYIGMGDGGLHYDRLGNGQNRSNLHSTILRIDPTPSAELNYSIPVDNPHVNSEKPFREEIYAYGLRNPYKMGIDHVTGNLWVGDVGQNDREEVNIIEKGGNFGWSIYEGTLCIQSDACDTITPIDPVYEYNHDQGHAIIGGLVYRGSSIPELYGTYIFADWLKGEVFGLNSTNYDDIELLAEVSFLTASITQDTNQELYFCGFDGSIYRLE